MLSVVPSLCSLESMVLIDNSLDEALKFLAPLAVFSVQSSNQPPNSDQLGYQICSSCKQLSIATEYHQQANCSTRVTIIILQFPSYICHFPDQLTLHTHYTILFQSLQTSTFHPLSPFPLESSLIPYTSQRKWTLDTRTLSTSCYETYKPTSHLYLPLPLSSQENQGSLSSYLRKPFSYILCSQGGCEI